MSKLTEILTGLFSKLQQSAHISLESCFNLIGSGHTKETQWRVDRSAWLLSRNFSKPQIAHINNTGYHRVFYLFFEYFDQELSLQLRVQKLYKVRSNN